VIDMELPGIHNLDCSDCDPTHMAVIVSSRDDEVYCRMCGLVLV